VAGSAVLPPALVSMVEPGCRRSASDALRSRFRFSRTCIIRLPDRGLDSAIHAIGRGDLSANIAASQPQPYPLRSGQLNRPRLVLGRDHAHLGIGQGVIPARPNSDAHVACGPTQRDRQAGRGADEGDAVVFNESGARSASPAPGKMRSAREGSSCSRE
jgi:hypothetical protein